MRGKYTYRSNAAQLSRDGKYVFTSTRGWNNTDANGWVAAFALGENGTLESDQALAYYEAPLSLGSAAGLRVAFWEDESMPGADGITDYMYLSDTEEGYMYVLAWMPYNNTISQVAALKYPDDAAPYEATWLD
jgi:carboxy-cis,cis-muconate cyclase